MLLAPGAAILGPARRASAESGGLNAGDAAILRFLAAAEILESDLWEQYLGTRWSTFWRKRSNSAR